MTFYHTNPTTSSQQIVSQTLRKQLRKQRRALSGQAKHSAAFTASLYLYKLIRQLPKNAKIGLYLDDFGELPTAPIVSFCLRFGFAPYLPITEPNRPLHFVPMFTRTKKTPVKRHKLGMLEPITRPKLAANQLDVIICPLVAVDKRGNRLGMGGGFYDRTFERAPKVLKVAWCYDFQRMDALASNPWDKKVDIIISPSGIRYCR